MTRRTTSKWSITAAKASLHEVIERACEVGPQFITRCGRPIAVVVSSDEWKRKTHRTGNLAEFFAASPLRGSNIKLARSKQRPRDVDL